MFHYVQYMSKAEFVALVSLKVPSGTNRCQTGMCMQCVYPIPTELPFCIPPLVVG